MSINAIDERYLPGIRWAILRTCRVGGHLGATETMVRDVLVADYPAVSRAFIRDQFDYLEKRELIEVERSDLDPWRASLARYGYDVVEYQVECDPGIRRPPRLDPHAD